MGSGAYRVQGLADDGKCPSGSGRCATVVSWKESLRGVQGGNGAASITERKGWGMTGSAPRALDVAHVIVSWKENPRGGPGGEWREVAPRAKG